MSRLGERDLRIDFFRGLALLLIVPNHVDIFTQAYQFKWTFKWLHLGLSDAAELFVFLSGYVYAMVYGRILQRQGFIACWKKSLRRVLELYWAYLRTFGVLLLLLWVSQLEPSPMMRLSTYLSSWEGFVSGIFLVRTPALLDILTLYMLLLALAPIILWALARGQSWPLFLSAAVYLTAQVWPSSMGFDPRGWQLLFIIAMLASFKEWTVPRSGALLWLAASFLLIVTLPRLSRVLEIWPTVQAWAPWTFGAKSPLGPLRLLHFAALFYVVSAWLPARHSIFASLWLRPVVVCGQYSLSVFCVGVILSHVLGLWLLQEPLGSLGFHAAILSSWCLMLAWAAQKAARRALRLAPSA